MLQPRITTYYSSRTEVLTAELCRQLIVDKHSALNKPFQRTQIIVPNSGMQRYLALKIAEKFGICAHIDMDYAGRFLWQAYRQVLNNESPAHWDERLLAFALLNLWQQDKAPIDQRLQALLNQYYQPRQRYLLAIRVARLLRHYLNERPAMIDAWLSGHLHSDHPHESWQRHMLLQLIRHLNLETVSRSHWQQRFAAALANNAATTLPPVVHVFGFHTLPAGQLADLQAISQVSPVIFYSFNPSVIYWQDIVPEAVQARAAMTRADEAALMSVGHPLLASWGQSGKYLIEQLNQYENNNHDENTVPPAPHSLLTWLQDDIRQLNAAAVDVSKLYAHEVKHSHHPVDFSLSLHAAANPRREVEVLYDNLCHCFANSDLNPADVLVIVPQLADYAPHIQAIFARRSDHVGLPFSLANQTALQADADVQAFLALLTVIDSDFQAQALFECLNESRIQSALNISHSELQTLRHWLADSRYSLHFFDNNNGTSSSLEKLLDSLLLAHIGGQDTVLGKRQAASFYDSGQPEVLNILCKLWQLFLPFATLKSRQLSLSQWLSELRRLADAFLPWRHDMDTRLTTWFDSIAAAEQDQRYTFATLLADLQNLWQNELLHGPFLSGGVSFSAMMPMRSIPAKMIAVLGLNNDFPALSSKDPLDIRQAHPLWSDKNHHKEQQYFFLETLMAAREKLYLSYIGLDEQTGKRLPPSALVSELFGYLQRHIADIAEKLTCTYALQGFAATHSYQTLYNTEDTEKNNSENNIDGIDEPEASTPPALLTEKQLAEVLHQPLSAYWRYHLGASGLQDTLAPLAAHEFIATDSGLDSWHYRQAVLQAAAHHNDTPTSAAEALQQRNLYAPPVISEALLTEAKTYTAELQTELSKLSSDTPVQAINELIKFSFDGENRYLRLRAQYYGKHGLIHAHVGKNNEQKQLRVWAAHVLYHCHAAFAPAPSLLLTLDKGKVNRTEFAPLTTADAHTALHAMLGLLDTAIAHPYPLLLCKGKRGDSTRFVYQIKAYPLYPKIPPADVAHLAELQALWAPIDALFTAAQR